MQTLDLTLSQKTHLEANAQPVLSKLDEAIVALQTARNAFSGANDNRTLILKLADQVHTEAEELSSVLDVDMDAVNSSLAWRETRTTFLGIGREISSAASLICSDDPAAAFPLKRFRQSVRQLVEHVNAFHEGSDTRPAITTSVDEVRARWADVLAMDTAFDSWGPNRLSDACKQLLTVIARPIQPEPEPESHPANPLRIQLSDALFELVDSMGLLSVNTTLAESSLIERRAVIQKVRDLQRRVVRDFSEELTDGAKILAELRSIQNDVARLRNLDRNPHGPLSRLISDSEPVMERPLAKIRALLAPAAPLPLASRAENLLGRARQAFGWGDEPEVA